MLRKSLNVILKKRDVANRLNRFFVVKQFNLPDLGEGLKEGKVVEYFVKEGQTVKKFQDICQIEVAKGKHSVTSLYAGSITKFLVPVGHSCLVGSPLYEIYVNDGSEGIRENKSDSPRDNENSTNGQSQVEPIQSFKVHVDENIRKSNESSSILSTPAVRELAKKMHIPLEIVKGTGPNNRITKEDVLNLSHFINAVKGIEVPKIEQPTQTTSSINPYVKTQKHTMTSFEQAMVESMTYAATIPHFNLHEEFDISDLHQMRLKLKQSGINISLFALIVKSFSLALSESPKINSTYYPDREKYSYNLNFHHNICIAIDSKHGLAAPNIKNVQNLSSEEIDREVKTLKKLADQNSLQLEHVSGGTITISNIGSISGYLATPLNLIGQCCILALGKVVVKPVWVEEKKSFEPRQILPVSFGCDHRVLDGATVAKFSKGWRHYIEEPYLIFSKLK